MEQVDISIIIATRNRTEILCETVWKAMVAIEKRAVEIVVVNDGDGPLVLPTEILNGIQYFDNPQRGVSSARNFGARQARGSILFFLDDDMWVNEAALNWILANFKDAQHAASVYNIDWEYPPGLMTQLSQTKVGRYLLAANYNTMWGRMHQPGTQPANGLYPFDNIASGSLVMHIDIFKKSGGYNEAMIFQGEDIDLSNKMNRLAITIYAVFDTTLHHNHQDRLTIEHYLKRENSGYQSEFNAVKANLIQTTGIEKYGGTFKPFFEFFRVSEKYWISLLKLLPNHAFFNPVNNKLIGILAGLQRYKQWRNIMKDN